MTNLPVPTDPTLAQLEDRIADGLTCAGEALAEIRTRKLYLADYASFDDYCREKWGIAGRTALRKIAQAVATKALPAGAQVPSQRELARGNQPEAADDAGRVDARVHSSDAPDVPSRTIVARPLDTISPDAVLTGSAPREAVSTNVERPTPPTTVLAAPEPDEPALAPLVPTERAQIAHFYGHLDDLAPADLWNGSTPAQQDRLAAWINELRAAKMAAQGITTAQTPVRRGPDRPLRPVPTPPPPRAGRRAHDPTCPCLACKPAAKVGAK